jgi:transposase
VIFVGIDWAERHHDVCVLDEVGTVLGTGRIPDGIEGVARLHATVGGHAEDPGEVVVGIETDRGLLVEALVATGYRVYAVNPFSVSRYRERHTTSGSKSDPGDAKVLADLVRTDRHNHREVAGDTELAEAVKVLARAHQGVIWSRQRQVNALRNALREFYPGALQAFGANLASSEALAVLAIAPTPAAGRALTFARIRRALQGAGRARNLDRRATEVFETLRLPQLEAPSVVAEAYGETVRSMVKIVGELLAQTARLEQELAERFERHPDAEILHSLPGLGVILGARVLAEFGDDPTRYGDATARRCYAGTAPRTRASGTRLVVLARVARNRRLADACYNWAFSALNSSPGARRHYDLRRGRGNTHHQALRSVANRLVGILHGCLLHRSLYSEDIAWPTPTGAAA